MGGRCRRAAGNGQASDPRECKAGRHGGADEQRGLALGEAAEVAQQALQIVRAQRRGQGGQFVGPLLDQLGDPIGLAFELLAGFVDGLDAATENGHTLDLVGKVGLLGFGDRAGLVADRAQGG